MAIKAGDGKLDEAELYAPDLDDDGNLDPETYPLPKGDQIEDPYLSEVWDAAAKLLDDPDDDEDEDDDGDDPALTAAEQKGIGDTVQAAGKWLADRWMQLEGRYGRKQALAMAVAMLATMPLPGNIAAVVGAAEAIRGLSGYFQRELDGDVGTLENYDDTGMGKWR